MNDTELNTRAIEDFKVNDAAKTQEDKDFLRWIKEQFDEAYAYHEKKTPEWDYLWWKYENKGTEDHYDTEEATGNSRGVYSCGIIPQLSDKMTSIITSENPKPLINSILVEGFEQTFRQMCETGGLDNTWLTWAADAGAITIEQIDEKGNVRVTGYDHEGIKNFFDTVGDYIFNDLQRSQNMPSINRTIALWNTLGGEGYGKIILTEDVDDITAEFQVINAYNVLDDPIATTHSGRRYIFHCKLMTVARVIQDYGVGRDDIVADDRFSMRYPDVTDETPMDFRYKTACVLVVEGYFVDKRKEGGKRKYPTGRIITFIPGQPDKNYSGIRVLSDHANPFNGIPLQKCVMKTCKDELHGKPLIRDVISLSNNADQMMQQELLNRKMTGNNFLAYTEDALDHPDNIDNEIATKILIKDPNGYKLERGQPFDQSSLAVTDFMLNQAQTITGVNQASQGQKPPDVVSGAAIRFLQTATSELFKICSQGYEAFLNRIFSIYAGIIPKICKQGYRFRYGDTLKEMAVLPFDMEIFVEAFETYIVPGTTIPKDELSQKNLLLSLAGLPPINNIPVITQKQLIMGLGLNNAAAIIKDSEHQAAIDAQMQQMQQKIQTDEQQIAEMAKQIENLTGENQQLQVAVKGDTVKGMTVMEQQQMKEKGFMERQIIGANMNADLEMKKASIGLIGKAINQKPVAPNIGGSQKR